MKGRRGRLNRRNLLKGLAAFPALSGLGPLGRAARVLATPAGAAAPLSRVRPSDPGWPSAEKWAALKEQVGGRLVPVAAPLAPCKDAPNSPACAARLDEMKNPYFIGEQPGATQLAGWLDAWTSAPSVYAVAARSASDVAAAIDFARVHNLRLVVKGGGHSYLGTSNAPDSLLIWTHEMRGIELHDAFVPRGTAAAPRPAVSLEAGVRWLEAYDAVTTRGGRYVQGGGCCTVGVVGLLQGGGFGSFSKNYGLAAASLLEAEVVTADGKVRVVNAANDPELFWGLKGGGAGSLAVATRVTVATHELPEWMGGAEGRIRARSDAAFRRLVAGFLGFYEKSLLNPHWGEQARFGRDNSLKIQMVFAGLSDDDAEGAWKPFRDFVAASPSDFEVLDPIRVGTMSARHWWDAQWRRQHTPDAMVSDPRPGAPPGNVWWSGNSGEVNAFLYAYESLWMPARLFQDLPRLTDAIFEGSRHFPLEFHFNKGLAGAPPERLAEARATATNPAVLDAFALVIVATGAPHSNPGVSGHEPDPGKGRQEAAEVAAAADRLRALVPDAGSYANESNYFDRQFTKTYWGPNYPRLAEAKKKYDPQGLFFVHNGVGSEQWSADGFTRRS